MAVGDVKFTKQVVPVYVWRKAASGYTPTKGDPVSFDSSGDVQKATDSHDGPYGVYTGVSNTFNTATTYYQILVWGIAVLTMGGAVKPNKYVTVNSSSKLIEWVATQSPTYAQGEQQLSIRVFGLYMFLESDRDSVYAGSGAADTNLGVIWVGRTP